MTWIALLMLGVKWIWVGRWLGTPDYPSHRYPIITTLAMLAGAACLLSCIAPRLRARYAVLFDACGSVLALTDLWYARFYGDVSSVADGAHLPSLRFVTASLIEQVRWTDALLTVDLVPLSVIAARRPSKRARRSGGLRVVLASTALLGALPAVGIVALDPDEVFVYGFRRAEIVGALGMPGYHMYDLAAYIGFPFAGRLATSAADLDSAEAFIRHRRASEFTGPLEGVAKGKNVILVSAESLHDFVLGATIEGRPLTPHLNAFVAESLRFTEFYDQTHFGTTADAEFAALASRLPLDAGAVATRYSANRFRALPHVLSEHGYSTWSTAAQPPSVWNMRHMHRALGFSKSRFLPEFGPGEWIGVGMNDQDFFTQTAALLPAQSEPFMAYLLTSSNHHPYDLPGHLRQPEMKTASGTMAGDYLQSVNYFDRAFGAFIGELRRSGTLDRSVVVVFGDHQSWIPDADLAVLWNALNQREPAPLDLWRFRRLMPLLIRLPGGEAAGPRAVPGGHLDIAPTVLSLLGIDSIGAPWLGHSLVAPASRLVVFRDGSFTDGQTFQWTKPGGAVFCAGRKSERVDCTLLEQRRGQARDLIATSDRIIAGDLALPLTARLTRSPPQSRATAGRVMVIAHRGMSIQYPENTMEALLGALNAGADAVEIDVRLSRDGVPIVFHDDTLERTSNGTGDVSMRTVRELKALDAGSWMGPQFRGARIPTLLEVVRATAGRGALLLDLKMDGMAQAVASVFAAAGVDAHQALIGGWTRAQRDDFARHMPGARVLRTEAAPVAWSGDFYRRLHTETVWGFELGDDWPAAFVADARLNGMPVIAYTVNDEPTMRQLIEMGISGIETDDPALLIRVAKEMGAR